MVDLVAAGWLWHKEATVEEDFERELIVFEVGENCKTWAMDCFDLERNLSSNEQIWEAVASRLSAFY